MVVVHLNILSIEMCTRSWKSVLVFNCKAVVDINDIGFLHVLCSITCKGPQFGTLCRLFTDFPGSIAAIVGHYLV